MLCVGLATWKKSFGQTRLVAFMPSSLFQFHLAKLWSESFSASLENDQNDQWHIFSAHIANACAACFCRSWFWGERGGATATKKKKRKTVVFSSVQTSSFPYSWRPLSRACCVAMQRSVNEMSLLRLFWPGMPLPLCLWTLRIFKWGWMWFGRSAQVYSSNTVDGSVDPSSNIPGVCGLYLMYVSVRRDDQNHGHCMSSCAAAD